MSGNPFSWKLDNQAPWLLSDSHRSLTSQWMKGKICEKFRGKKIFIFIFCYSIHWSLFEASSIISSCYYSFIKVPRVRITLHKALNCKIYINFTWTKIWNLKLQTCCRFLEKTGSRYGICKASVYSALIERRSPRKPHNTDCRVDIVASGSNWSIHCIKAD